MTHTNGMEQREDGSPAVNLRGSYRPAQGKCFRELVAREVTAIASSVMVRRSVFDEVGGFDAQMVGEDLDFYAAVAAHGYSIGFETTPLIVKSARGDSLGSHFVEVGVDAWTGETRIRRMLSVCDAGRILNPLSARSQVIGAMVMAAGAALMEELAVDKRFGFFVNHDLAGYEVPVHADIPHQEVVFLDTADAVSSPLKAKGVGELGICGPGAAIANAIYNATGVRVREYPLTLDKYLDKLPAVTTA